MGWKNNIANPGTRKWDRLLEKFGLLKGQVQNKSVGEIEEGYFKLSRATGVGVEPDWDSYGGKPASGGGLFNAPGVPGASGSSSAPGGGQATTAPKLSSAYTSDTGAWDGYWTFEALKRGAKEVVAIDDFSDYLGSLEKSQRKAWEPFDLCSAALGYSEDRCKRIDMSVYDIAEENLGLFDNVFFFGTLYHLRHPLLALDKISALCKDQLYIESAILDDFSPYRGGLSHGYPGQQMVMAFYPGREYCNNSTNWWVPTLNCLMYMTFTAGSPLLRVGN